MYTTEAILARLGEEPRGQTVLVNLLRSIEANLVPADKVRDAFERFASDLGDDRRPLPPCGTLAERLGQYFVMLGLWRKSTQPQLQAHHAGGQQVLSRITSYGRLHALLTSAGVRSPYLPKPRLRTATGGGEIASAAVPALRHYLEARHWERDMLRPRIVIQTNVVWLTASAALPALTDGVANLANVDRDRIGLSHLRSGQHRFRIDIDLNKKPFSGEWQCRRPHGAGNGGARFRVEYDDPVKTCNWGRTVDLELVRRKAATSIDGVPELLMDECRPRAAAVSILYVGRVTRNPEREDQYFAERLGTVEAAALAARLRQPERK